MKKEKLFEKEREFYSGCFKRKKIVLKEGRGTAVFDSDGKKYLDFVGAIATTSIGYSNPAVTKAINAQAKKLLNATNLYYTEQQILLAERLARISALRKSFISNSGTEAMEAAIKLARKSTAKKGIIFTENAFHGRTMGALSATWKKEYRAPFEPLVPYFKSIPFNDAKALEKAIDADTAAFVVEPVQGEAGIIVPRKNYLKRVAKTCSKKGILLILDEIQTGCGRTGKFFAFQRCGIKPDIVLLAKGLANGIAIGVMIAREGLDFAPGEHGSTFGGNPLACSAALAVLREIEEKKLAEKAAKKGKIFKQKLLALKKKFPFISSVRGEGLMLAVEFTGIEANAVVDKCIERGLLLNGIDNKILRFLPPLTISVQEISAGVKILEGVLKECTLLE